MNIRRISLRSMFWYMVKRIWIILLCAVCCGALLAGYKYMKDKKSADSKVSDDGSGLTDQERQDVENSASQYKYQLETEAYLTESPLMKMNPKKEPQILVEYLIRMDYAGDSSAQKFYTDGVIENTYLQMLRAYINDGMYLPDLVKVDSTYDGFGYIKELVWCNNSGGGEFTLGVIAYDPYPNLAADVRKVTEAYMAELMEKEKGLSITAVKEGSYSIYDSTTDTAQKNAVSNMVTYRKAVANAYNNFSAEQQAYFWNLVGGKKTESAEKTKVGFSKKFAAVGVVLGFAGGIFLLIIMLYLSPKHASPADYTENAGLRSFGMVYLPGKGGWTLKKELKGSLFPSNEESVNYAALRIGTYCKAHEISDLAVLSSAGTKKVEQAVEKLGKALKKESITLHSTEHVAEDSKALQELLKVKKCIFLEELHGGSRMKQQELLQFCRENEVEVIGALGVTELMLGDTAKA